MKAKPLYMETTSIEAAQTAAEICKVLVSAGARQIQMDYAEGGKLVGINFVLIVANLPYPFKLPARTESVKTIFKDRRRKTQGWNAHKYEKADAEQAERVAWRQLLRWVQAQIAMIDAGMVQAREVFAPYLLEPSGRTLFEYLEETRFKALPPRGTGPPAEGRRGDRDARRCERMAKTGDGLWD